MAENCTAHEGKGVLFDLDDSLLDLKNAVIPFNNAYYGVEVACEDYSGSFFSTAWGRNFATQEDFNRDIDTIWFNRAKQERFYENVRALRGAKRMLQGLHEQGVPFWIATSWPNLIRRETTICLEREFAGVDLGEVMLLGDNGYGVTKGQLAKDLGVRVLVDDTRHNINSALALGVCGLLFGDGKDNESIETDETRGLYRGIDWERDAELVLHRILGIV